MNEETSELEEMLENLTLEYTGQNGRFVVNVLLPTCTLHLYVVNVYDKPIVIKTLWLLMFLLPKLVVSLLQE